MEALPEHKPKLNGTNAHVSRSCKIEEKKSFQKQVYSKEDPQISRTTFGQTKTLITKPRPARLIHVAKNK